MASYIQNILIIILIGCSRFLPFEINPPVQATLRLQWNANSEGDLSGYNIYYRQEGKQEQSVFVDTTSYDLTVLVGHTIYWQLTAVDTNNNESARSAVLIYPDGREPKLIEAVYYEN